MADNPRTRRERVIWWLIAFVFAFFIVKEFRQTFWHGGSEKVQVAKVAVDLEKMRAEAVKERPDAAPGTAFQEKATEVDDAKDAAQSGEKKAETAADLYFGFFAVNARARTEFCKVQGVDVSAWTAAFEKINARETARAKEIHAKKDY